MGLLRFARNDKETLFSLYPKPQLLELIADLASYIFNICWEKESIDCWLQTGYGKDLLRLPLPSFPVEA